MSRAGNYPSIGVYHHLTVTISRAKIISMRSLIDLLLVIFYNCSAMFSILHLLPRFFDSVCCALGVTAVFGFAYDISGFLMTTDAVGVLIVTAASTGNGDIGLGHRYSYRHWVGWWWQNWLKHHILTNGKGLKVSLRCCNRRKTRGCWNQSFHSTPNSVIHYKLRFSSIPMD